MCKFAMSFPGQGSQHVGMLKSMFKAYAVVRLTFEEASSILNYDLWKLIQSGPDIELNKTYIAQPAILTSSVAIFRAWKEYYDVMPNLMIGHSLGEYSALVCSGVIDFRECLKLVQIRGLLMQNIAFKKKYSVIAIIGLNIKTIVKIQKSYFLKDFYVSNFNTPIQTVVVVTCSILDRVIKIFKMFGATNVFSLPINVPVHTKIMRSISKSFASEIQKINLCKPKIPIINSIDVKFDKNTDNITDHLVRQLYMPVQWYKCIDFIVSNNVFKIFEIGPKNILSKLTNMVNKKLITISINNPKALHKASKLIFS